MPTALEPPTVPPSAGPPLHPPAGPPPSGPPPSDPSWEERRAASDPSRTGTLWIAATGAALLLAAAAVLTAVRWGDIGQTAKLGGFVAITLAMLLGGRRSEPFIPLTGRAIFHLGALLIPLDMAAMAVLAERTWQETLLLTSLTAVVSWYALQRVDRSAVLQWAARGSVVLAAAGVAAVSPVSMPLLLAIAAAGAVAATVLPTGFESLFGRPTGRTATMWTLLAGVLPIAAFQEWPIQLAPTADELGFVAADRPQLIAAALFATAISAVHARFRPSLERGWITVVLALCAAVVTGAMFATSHVWILSSALLFLAIELVALAVRRDELWMRVVNVLGPIAEVSAGVVMLVALVDSIFASHAPSLAIAGVVLGLGWLTADRRRLLEPHDWFVGLLFGSDWAPATVFVPLSALVAAVAFDASALGVSIVLIACTAWIVLTMRRNGQVVATVALLGAIALTNVGWSGVAVVASAAILTGLWARLELRNNDVGASVFTAALAGMFAAILWVPLEPIAGPGVATLSIAVGAWALGWVVSTRASAVAALMPRLISVTTLAGVWQLDEVPAIVLCVVLAALGAFEAWRTRLWEIAAVSLVSLGLLAVPIASLVSFSPADTGVILITIGLVFVGLLAALPRVLQIPLTVAASIVTVAGLVMAAPVSSALAPALMLVGVSAVLFGAIERTAVVAGVGVLLVMVGSWMQLALWEVTWVEPYLAMPAVVALFAGWFAHRNGTSSWIAFAPTIAVLGGVAAADRFLGGSAWHAVIAGGVAVLAILAGGLWRLIGPLVTGTVLIAMVTIYESLGPGSRVPTWGWLALGGVVLLGAAVQMERSETTPLEQGQRLVQVLTTRFS